MQFTTIFLASLAACAVAARGGEESVSSQVPGAAKATGGSSTSKNGTKTTGAGGAKATGGAAATGSRGGNATQTGRPVSTGAAVALAGSASGGLVTVAGLGVVFAVFM